jgi:hypothetical protein
MESVFHIDAMRGSSEARSEVYMTYTERALELLTMQGAM